MYRDAGSPAFPYKKAAVLVAVLFSVFGLCGCAEMITLTSEEEQEIAIYTSSLISKYNRNQDKGISYVSGYRLEQINEQRLLEEAEAFDDTADDASEAEETEAAPEIDTSAYEIDPETGNLVDPATGYYIDATTGQLINPETGEVIMEVGTSGGIESDTGEDADGSQGQITAAGGGDVTLSDILSVNGLSASFVGAELSDHYAMDEYFDLSPTRGYQFLVLTFTVENTTSSEMTVDLDSLGLTYKATVDGVTARSDKTILINDMQTFVGTLEGKEKKNLVLLFQYPQGRLSDASGLSLSTEYGGSKYRIIL